MDKAARGQLVDLPADECWQLLTTTPVGRIAWSTSTGPVVVPVNFAVDGRTIKIRTAAYSAMVQKADVERVAFQVDRIDEATHTGWAPWFVANTDDKRRGRLNIITHLLSRIPYSPPAARTVKFPRRQAPGGYVEPQVVAEEIPTPY